MAKQFVITGRLAERNLAREILRKEQIANDALENAARIREQIEPDLPEDTTWEDWARSKLSDDELHPDYENE